MQNYVFLHFPGVRIQSEYLRVGIRPQKLEKNPLLMAYGIKLNLGGEHKVLSKGWRRMQK